MSIEYRVKFLPMDRSIPAAAGQNLLEVAMAAGVHINASCSGNGVCGKCKVKFLDGKMPSGVHPKVSREEYDAGVRLACQSVVQSDMVVEIPLESQIDKSVLKRTATDAHISYDYRKEQIFQDIIIDPLVAKIYVELPEPVAEDNISDWSRLLRGLKDSFQGRNLVTSLEVIKGLSLTFRESQWKVTATCALRGDNIEVIAVDPGNVTAEVYSIAIDIGTTTVCGRLCQVALTGRGDGAQRTEEEPARGRIVAEAADYNGQIGYGEDVISRIMYARKKGGLKRLQGVVVKTINGVIGELLALSGITKDAVSHVVFAGNTTMTHLLLGINPTYIMLAPYTPAATFFPTGNARRLGIDLSERVDSYTVACVASYVGGDVVSGVLASAMAREEDVSLFMDIGTNGEIVLGNREWLLSASCSAGPAFEGGGIQFGVRASPGAIEQVKIHPSTCEPMILTIGKARPMGICGSGLIDLAAGLLEAGLIDQRGKFNRNACTDRIRNHDGVQEYLICHASETAINKDIVITEIDLDNLIRTKAAIFAGCKVLLDSAGLTFRDLRKVIIAGGFGRYIDIEKAKTIGLLPELPDDRFRFIGNSSLTGAHLITLDKGLWLESERIARLMTNVELSNSTRFMDDFMAAMFLPHTDESLFPEITQRLRSV